MDLEKGEAEARQAEAETRKLDSDNRWWARLLSYLAPFLTAATAALGVFFSVRKVGEDRRDARESAETERFDERFASAVAGLSSEKPGEQSGAAVLVASMVREKREALSSQALLLLLVALQTSHDKTCEDLLRHALERFARTAPERLIGTSDHEAVGALARVNTPELDLAGISLPGLDIAFANLPKADFRRADLRGCRGLEAQLDKARFDDSILTEAAWAKVQAQDASFQRAHIDRATLRQADLSGANFYRADLRKTNLRHAKLIGTRFRSASLEKTDFYGAEMDDRTLRSILEASDWRAAEFSREARVRLEQIEGG